MLSFNFLNFFFQSFVKCPSKSKTTITKKKGNAKLAETRTVSVMVVEKKKKNREIAYILYKKSSSSVIIGMMKREIQNTIQEYSIRSWNK